MDVLAVCAAIREAADYVRAGNGPMLIEALTYRYLGHSKSDSQLYRTKEEVEAWKQKDAIERFERYLRRDRHAATQAEVDALKAKADDAIEEAIAYGDAGPEPQVAHLTATSTPRSRRCWPRPSRCCPSGRRQPSASATRINPPRAGRRARDHLLGGAAGGHGAGAG